MATVHVVVRIPHRSGLLEDQANHTFNFITATADEETYDEIVGCLNRFYFIAHSPITENLQRWFSPCVLRGSPMTYDFYLPTASGTGSPVYSAPSNNLGAETVGDNPLPSEVSTVLSYRADYSGVPEFGSGVRPRARRRGRLFFGPLVTAASAEGTFQRAVVNSILQDTLVAAAEALILETVATWAVWSRTDDTFREVVAAQVDNAFDIQRRRGEDPSGLVGVGPSLALGRTLRTERVPGAPDPS